MLCCETDWCGSGVKWPNCHLDRQMLGDGQTERGRDREREGEGQTERDRERERERDDALCRPISLVG